MRNFLLGYVTGLLGAILGGILGGYLAYQAWMQGFYALVLPGALVGLGCGMLSWTNSNLRGVLSAVLAALAGLLSEWLICFLPAEKTLDNFIGFLKQMTNEPRITQIFLTLGAILGFWWGRECTFRSRLLASRPNSKPAEPK